MKNEVKTKAEATTVRMVVERGSDGNYSAYMDCYDYDFMVFGVGATAQAAIDDFYAAYADMRAHKERVGEPMPELKFEVRYDVSAFLDYYAAVLSKAGLSRLTGINQKQLWHYARGLSRPRPETVRKIRESVSDFAQRLQQVQLA